MPTGRFQPKDQPDLIHPDQWGGQPSSLAERLWDVPPNHPTDQTTVDSILRFVLHKDTVRILLDGHQLSRLVPSPTNRSPGDHLVNWPFTGTVYAEFPRPLPVPSATAPALMLGIILTPTDDNTLISLLPIIDDDDLTGRQARTDLTSWTTALVDNPQAYPPPTETSNIVLRLIALLAKCAPVLQLFPLDELQTQRLPASGAANPWLVVPTHPDCTA